MISHLPAELVGLVAGLADAASILALRLTCRTLYKETFVAFATIFFERVTIDLCPKSISRLRRIADDDRLRSYIRVVRFDYLESCPNPPRHQPGTGFQWDRDASSLCLNPSQQVISDLLTAFSCFHNCQTILVSQSISSWPDRPPPKSTELCIEDVAHIAFLAAARLPCIRSFQFLRGEHGGNTWSLPLLPLDTTVLLEGDWARCLADLELHWWKPNEGSGSIPTLCSVVLAARSLRRLSVKGMSAEFFRRLTSAPQVPPLEILDITTSSMSTQDLIAFTARFRDTLEHVHLYLFYLERNDTAAAAAAEFGRVFRHWACDLPRLKSFGLNLLRMGMIGPFYLVLNQVLDWDEPPDEGEMTLDVGRSGKKRGNVTSLWYAGSTEDVQRVLHKVAECCGDQVSPGQGTWGTIPVGREYLMVGKLRARCVFRKSAPELQI